MSAELNKSASSVEELFDDSLIDDEIIEEFLKECEELIANLDLQILERDQQDIGSVLSKINRILHSLKGMAQSVGYVEYGSQVHNIESYIDSNKATIEQNPKLQSELFSRFEVFVKISQLLFAAIQKRKPIDKFAGISFVEGPLEALFQVIKGFEVDANMDIIEDPFVKIKASKLDKLLGLLGEVSIQSSIINFAVLGGRHSDLKNSESAAIKLNRLARESQSVALSFRMQSLDLLFKKLKNAAIDAAKTCDKTIRVILEGAQHEVDKSILEVIHEPLIHVIRNAIDHGIESRAQRVQNGKSETGYLTISAEPGIDFVQITISDDGCGLNKESIKKKAIEKKLITPDEEVDEAELINMIFARGFSTKSKVSELSGRGVGLDVLKDTIENAGGTIQVQSEKGAGTVFTISIPASFSVLDCLIVSHLGITYAIPLKGIKSVVNLEDFKKIQMKDHTYTKIKGEVHLCKDLNNFLSSRRETNVETLAPENWEHALIFKGIPNCLFTVDHIRKKRPVVVSKKTGSMAKKPWIAGTTILADGLPAIILDAQILVKHFVEQYPEVFVWIDRDILENMDSLPANIDADQFDKAMGDLK